MPALAIGYEDQLEGLVGVLLHEEARLIHHRALEAEGEILDIDHAVDQALPAAASTKAAEEEDGELLQARLGSAEENFGRQRRSVFQHEYVLFERVSPEEKRMQMN